MFPLLLCLHGHSSAPCLVVEYDCFVGFGQDNPLCIGDEVVGTVHMWVSRWKFGRDLCRACELRCCAQEVLAFEASGLINVRRSYGEMDIWLALERGGQMYAIFEFL